MAICPSGAIEIFGRTLSPDDLFDLPDKEKTATYEQITISFTATYAMIAAETLGLGTCMIGGVQKRNT